MRDGISRVAKPPFVSRLAGHLCEMTGEESARVAPAAEEFLLSLGTDQVPHPGGTLHEHLLRVADLLARWGAMPELVAAGLCHACYGTDGFDHALLPASDRAKLAAVIGDRAEALVYLYGSCDRAAVYPLLAGVGPVPFRDRFTGQTRTRSEADIQAFAELTAANELDIAAHNSAMAAEHGPALMRLLAGARARLSDAAWQACLDILGDYQPHAPPS
jgi:hypothetical protein